MTQAEITAWEKSKLKSIVRWEIEYGEAYDTITFFFHGNNSVKFQREKP